MTKLHSRFQLANTLTLLAYAGIVCLFLLEHLLRAQGPKWAILLVQLLPLLILLPGIISRYYRAYSWLCFVLLLYFVMAVQGAFSSDANIYDGIFVFLTVFLFISAMFASRYAQRIQKPSSTITE